MARGVRHGGKEAGAWRALLLAVLALAMAAQALLVGTHRHEPAGRTHLAGAASRTAGHDGHHCAVCEMARVGGQYLLAGDVALVLAVVAAWLVGLYGGRHLPLRRVVVGWRSRAPPVAGVISFA